MNKRIQELKDQCYIPVAERVGDTEYDMEKFALLLIRECANLFDKDEIEISYVERRIHIIIKEHFGVEE